MKQQRDDGACPSGLTARSTHAQAHVHGRHEPTAAWRGHNSGGAAPRQYITYFNHRPLTCRRRLGHERRRRRQQAAMHETWRLSSESAASRWLAPCLACPHPAPFVWCHSSRDFGVVACQAAVDDDGGSNASGVSHPAVAASVPASTHVSDYPYHPPRIDPDLYQAAIPELIAPSADPRVRVGKRRVCDSRSAGARVLSWTPSRGSAVPPTVGRWPCLRLRVVCWHRVRGVDC